MGGSGEAVIAQRNWSGSGLGQSPAPANGRGLAHLAWSTSRTWLRGPSRRCFRGRLSWMLRSLSVPVDKVIPIVTTGAELRRVAGLADVGPLNPDDGRYGDEVYRVAPMGSW